MLKNTQDSYGLVARILHWLMAILIFGLIAVGLIMSELPKGDLKTQLVQTHKAIGALVLILLIIRLLWKLINPQPAPLSNDPRERLLGRLMHWALYVLIFLQAVSGVIMSQAHGYAVSVFGWFDLPTLVEKNKELAEAAEEVHEFVWIVLAIGIAIHMAAALKHHFVDKDRTLIRMLKG
jgi:cytochrome b561